MCAMLFNPMRHGTAHGTMYVVYFEQTFFRVVTSQVLLLLTMCVKCDYQVADIEIKTTLMHTGQIQQ